MSDGVFVKSVVTTTKDGEMEMTIRVENYDEKTSRAYLFYEIKRAIQQHMFG